MVDSGGFDLESLEEIWEILGDRFGGTNESGEVLLGDIVTESVRDMQNQPHNVQAGIPRRTLEVSSHVYVNVGLAGILSPEGKESPEDIKNAIDAVASTIYNDTIQRLSEVKDSDDIHPTASTSNMQIIHRSILRIIGERYKITTDSLQDQIQEIVNSGKNLDQIMVLGKQIMGLVDSQKKISKFLGHVYDTCFVQYSSAFVDRLKEIENRFTTAVREMTDGYYQVNLDGKFTDVNPALMNIFGYKREEDMLGINFKEHTGGGTGDRIWDMYHELFKGERDHIHLLEYKITRTDGEDRYIQVSAWREYDKKGRITGFNGIARDITDKKRADEKYRLAATSGGVVVWDWLVKGNVFTIDPLFKRMLGYEPDEIGDSIEERITLLREDHKKPVSEAILSCLSGETQGYEVEMAMKHKDGHDVWFLTRGEVVERDEGGKVSRMAGANIDITKLKVTQQALGQSEEHFKNISDLFPTVICEMDLQGKMVYLNRAGSDLFGITQEDIESGVYGLDYMVGNYRTMAGEEMAKIFEMPKGETGVSNEYVMKTALGERTMKITSAPRYVKLAEGKDKLVGMMCSMHDITSDVDRKVQLELANKELRDRTGELQNANQKLEHTTTELEAALKREIDRKGIDELTGLITVDRFTRHTLLDEINRILPSRKPGGNPYELTVVFGDIDDFKDVNDKYGHLVGDYVLKRVADVWKEVLYEKAWKTSRVGGEEYAAILPNMGIEEAYELVETLRKRVSQLEIKISEVATYADEDYQIYKEAMKMISTDQEIEEMEVHYQEFQSKLTMGEMDRDDIVKVTSSFGLYSTSDLKTDYLESIKGSDLDKIKHGYKQEDLDDEEIVRKIGIVVRVESTKRRVLFGPADEAMYAAKKAGIPIECKNRTAICDASGQVNRFYLGPGGKELKKPDKK